VSGAPRVVVGVPVRDSAHFLPETLAAIAAQDHPRLEVVISDDASRDGTLDICRDFAARDPRFRVVVHREPRGWIGNYNSLLAHASGDYFCWMPHDDLYDPGYVRTLVALLEARPDAVVAHAAGTLVDGAGRPLGPIPSARALEGTRSRLARALRHVWSTERAKGRAFRGVFRTAALRATRGLRPVHFAADSLLMFELSLRGPFAYDPRPLYRKRRHPGSVSENYGNALWEWLEYLDAHCDVVRDARLSRPERMLLLAAVRARQARFILARPLGIARRAALASR
jgi:glycosyltransferase involved in cell wall biosynthesis